MDVIHASNIPATIRPVGISSAGISRTRAFTLTEIMISIGLSLVLIAGVNAIFATGSRTMSSGQALAESNRDRQSIEGVFADDLASLASDTPAFVIRSQREPAFLNAADRARDLDYNNGVGSAAQVDANIRSLDINEDGDESDAASAQYPVPEVTSTAIYNDRNHRVDKLIFFMRGKFVRQTGQGAKLISPMTSREAYVAYGHLKKPTYGSPNAFRNPGIDLLTPAAPAPLDQTENPENFFASQWVLGRVQMLMRQPDGSSNIYDNSMPPVSQNYISRNAPDANDGSAAPFSVNTDGSGESQSADTRFLQEARYDLAGMTIDRYRPILAAFAANPANDAWWRVMAYFRFQCDLIPTRPLDAESIAQSTPALVSGCTQFIVEFAGDFIRQDPATGAPMTTGGPQGPDGITDFVIRGGVAGGARSIRWYGMPRDVTGGPNGEPNRVIEVEHDVLPVKDVLGRFGIATPYHFEHFEIGFTGTDVTPPGDYNYAAPGPNEMPPTALYYAAWGVDGGPTGSVDDPRPQLIRITIGINDARDRLVGQTFEYVFPVRF